VNASRTQVPAEASQLPGLTRFLRDFWAAAALPPSAAHPFEVALEEVFMNVATHGSAAGRIACVEVNLVLEHGEFTLAIDDDGPAFDPLTLPAPDVHARLEDRRVGGLGVYLVRQMMDAVSYAREGAHNRLRMSKRLALAGAAPAGTGQGKFG
jgi:serine/threonine-protein kinase RsbW